MDPKAASVTYISEYVVPVTGGLTFAESFDQFRSHQLHATAHMYEIGKPLLLELLVPEHFRHDPGAVDGRRCYFGARQPREKTECFGLGCFCPAYDVKDTNTFAVQPEVLGE